MNEKYDIQLKDNKNNNLYPLAHKDGHGYLVMGCLQVNLSYANNAYSVDKTWQELTAAYNANKYIYIYDGTKQLTEYSDGIAPLVNFGKQGSGFLSQNTFVFNRLGDNCYYTYKIENSLIIGSPPVVTVTTTTNSDVCTLTTAQTLSGAKTFTKNLTVDISDNSLPLYTVADILTFKYKNPDGQIKTVNPIRTLGDAETGTSWGGIAIIGSSNGGTVICSGESAPTVVANKQISNNENIYAIADSGIYLLTNANTAANVIESVSIDTNGRVLLYNHGNTGFYARNVSYGTAAPTSGQGNVGDIYIQYVN